MPAAIPLIRAISRLLWNFPLPEEGVRGQLRGDRKLKEEGKMQMTGGKTLSVEAAPRALFPWPEQTTHLVGRTVYFVSREMLVLA